MAYYLNSKRQPDSADHNWLLNLYASDNLTKDILLNE
jgi:hypothetical protein